MTDGFTQSPWMRPEVEARCDTDADLRCGVAGRGMLRVAGEDAAGFLHAQFSSDIRGMRSGSLRLTSYSDARGRLLAVMQVLAEDEGFLLELPTDRLESVAAQLRRFVLRARVEIDDVSPDRAAFGLAGPAMKQILARSLERQPPGPGEWAALDGDVVLAAFGSNHPRWLAFGPEAGLQALWQRLDGLATAPPSCWDLLGIDAGIPSIHAATAGRFVAQMVNLDCLDALDFRKGCYPGQEVIARTRYLGRIKRRMFPLRVRGTERPPDPGEPVVDAGSGATVGELVRAAPHPDGGALCLAVLRLDAMDAALTLGDGSAATRLDPPYPLDQAA